MKTKVKGLAAEFDEKAMTLTFEYVETEEGEPLVVVAAFKVCPRCNGRGKHVNPAVDEHGISADEFAEDPDFAEDYFGGFYDVECHKCSGLRVVAAADDNELTFGQRALLEAAEREECNYQAMCAAERRMGC